MSDVDVKSVVTLGASVVWMVWYIFCILQAVSRKTRVWRIAPYVSAMGPALVHGFNYGIGFMTLSAILFFIALTKIMLVLAEKEWREL